MQFNSNPSRISRKIEIVEAVERVAFWHDALLDIRAERRQLIELESVSDARRGHLLQLNADQTTVIRKALSEAQHDHCDAIKASAERIAQSITLPADQLAVPPANDAVYDDYEGEL